MSTVGFITGSLALSAQFVRMPGGVGVLLVALAFFNLPSGQPKIAVDIRRLVDLI